MTVRTRARVTTAIRFDTEVYDRLTAAARDHDRPINWLVNQAVSDWLARLLPADEVVMTRPPSPPPALPGDLGEVLDTVVGREEVGP